MNTQLSAHDAVRIARSLMQRYGLRASAVAEERASEAQVAGEPAQLDHWRSVASAISELRRTRPTTH